MLNRRQAIRIGALGTGLTLSQFFRLADGGEATQDDGRSAILVFLKGGPSHQDMFDMKPNAASEYRGQFRPVATNVAGVEICEHLPRLARCTDKYAIVRGVTHNLADHGLGTRYLLTGNRPIPTLRYPAYGAVASRELAAAPGLPAFVAIDEDLEGPGYLGTQYGALATGEKPRVGRPFSVRGITLDDGLTIDRFASRRRLAEDVDQLFRDVERADDSVVGLDSFVRRAYEIISSPSSREAFDVALEPSSEIDRFGHLETGQSLLLACRLIEAGVRFVTVIVDGWDTHNDNFGQMKQTLLPQFDQGLSSLLSRLEQRELLDSTAVLVTGEFGRTPKVNGQAGRDHWARAMFSLMAGASVRGGQVIGATDGNASEPAGAGFTPDDVAASFYHNLGIDPRREHRTNTGRPVTLVRDGQPIRALFG